MYLRVVGRRFLSLVEVLLSLALIGLCVGVLFYGLQQNLRLAAKQAKDAMYRYEYHFLQKKIGEAFYDLESKRHSFFFTEKVAIPPFHSEYPLLAAGYYSAKSIAQSNIVKMFCLYVDQQSCLQLLKVENKKKEVETLCEEVEAVSYSFFDGQAVQEDPHESGWVDFWEKEREGFPQGIQITVRTKKGVHPFFFIILNEKSVVAETNL